MRDRLKLRDVRAVFRLVGEVREMGTEPQQWRPHMVRALAKLMDAAVVVSSEIHCTAARRDGSAHITDIGWGCYADGSLWQIQSDRDESSTDRQWIQTIAGQTEQLVHVKPVRHMHAGKNFILSQVSLPHVGTVDQLGLHHGWGKQFGHVEHKLVRLLHTELARLWKRDALRKAKDPTAALPPRLQQTLESLGNGASEKEVSVQLGISRHTVHNYVKALHQRFSVSSRGELLAKIRKQPGGFTPTFTSVSPR